MRYIPHTPNDIERMLGIIGVQSLSDLFSSIPKEFQLPRPLNLPNGMDEIELSRHITALAQKNKAHTYASFLGAGAYNHFIPSIVNYLSNQGDFLTAYTPYQPEISQGTLQAIFEFQTMIANLTGMDVSNACMYDGATALAESCLMAKRIQPQKSKILMPGNIHPEYQKICQTYMATQDVELSPMPYDPLTGQVDLVTLQSHLTSDTLAVLVQSPNFFGCIEDLEKIGSLCQKHKALFIVCVTEPLALALLTPPGKYGADIVVGEAQSFGNSISYGGPTVGFFTTKQQYVRSLPGRIVGQTVDQKGHRAFTLTLSTREQHIRREKATSNICTNEALLATRVAIYLSTLGETGLVKLAKLNHTQANEVAQCLQKIANIKFKARLAGPAPFFNEFVIETKNSAKTVLQKLKDQQILGGYLLEKDFPELKNCLLICVTEANTKEDIEKLCKIINEN